jgi:outer membrane protein assembly factor BamB
MPPAARLDVETGEDLWRFEANHEIYGSPIVVDGVVYFGSDDGSLYALDVASGEELWHYETGGFVGSSPAVANGTVFFGSYDGIVYAVH